MSPALSVSACVRACVVVTSTLLTLTGCASGAAHSSRPVAAVRSGPSAPSPVDPSHGVTEPAATPTAAPAPPALSQDSVPAETDQARPLVPPSPRFNPAMASDGRGEVVLFGGEILAGGFPTFFSDTWTWNGRHWTRRSPAHSPSPRAAAELAYDPRHHQVVLFGGFGPAGPTLTDTWLWDGRDWTQATPAFDPAPTHRQGITFFSGTGTVLMFSGNGFGSHHVYSWDGSNWTDLPFSGGPPSTVFRGGFSVDPERQVVVLLTDDVNKPNLEQWEFDGRTWTQANVVTPPRRSLIQTATDERTDTIVMFGGTGHNDTWTWDGRRWTQQQPLHSPSARTGTGPMPGMAYDAARGEVVVFGGIDPQTNVTLNDTWTWNGTDWTSR